MRHRNFIAPGLLVVSIPAMAQTAPLAATASTVVPALVPYSGVALNSDNKPQTVESSVTFLIFKDQTGGEPLWVETQNVAFDPAGHYTVHLGAANPSGLPTNLFATGEARWLEVQVAGAAPQPRVLLATVPYAMKAADAATLGGLPASAFALAGSAQNVTTSVASGNTPDASSSTVTTTGGTSHYVPIFTGTTSIGDSQIYDAGTGVGIGDVPNKFAKLDVNGEMIMRGNMQVTRAGNATSSKGFPSYGFEFFSSAYNSSTKALDNPFFSLQSEPTGNNTSSPSATFNLLFSNNGAAPAETGLSINSSGIINFANGQTFNLSSSAGVAVDGTSSSGTGVQGTSGSGDGVFGYSAGSSVNTAGVLGNAGGTSGFSGIAGVWGDAYNHVGVYGSSQQAAGVEGISATGLGVQGISTSSAGVQGTSTSGNGVHGVSQSTSGIFGETSSTSTGDAALYGYSHSNAIGVYGYSGGSAGVAGSSSTGNGVQGNASTGIAVRAIGDTGYGMYGSTTSGQAVAGSAQSGIAGSFSNNSNTNATVQATNYASGSSALLTNSSSSQPAVVGINYGATVGVYGYSPQGQGVGIEGNSIAGIGVYAATNAQSTGFQLGSFTGPVALWADSTPPNGDGGGIAVRATANDNNAGNFTNNSQYSTIYSYNYGSGGDTASPFNTFEAASPNGTCGFGGNGDLACTGQVKALVTTGGGARKVETYAMQSPENWMEDFGSATLHNGTATVSIDAAFAETVSDRADYHVFLTPNGDSKGLYVVAKTAAGFEVRESGGGTATLSFDYRIVARRRGYESQRLVDVTERFKADKDHMAARLLTESPQAQKQNKDGGVDAQVQSNSIRNLRR
jgi:hypothetical protein